MFRVIIACGQDFQDYPLLRQTMDRLLVNVRDDIMIVSGQRQGVASLGERYAMAHGYSVQAVPSFPDRYGLAADYVQNLEMVDCADALVAFWDGQSECMKHLIEAARQKRLNVRIVRDMHLRCERPGAAG